MSDLSRFANVNSANFGLGIQKGLYDKLSGVEVTGYNPVIGSTYETIWDGSDVYTYPSAATTMNVASEAGATDNGVEIVIQGLDANYNPISETVTLGEDSAGGTSTTVEFLRIFSATVSNGQAPTDDVLITQDGNTYALITFPYNRTQMGIYTIPAGKRAYILYASISLEKQKEVIAKLLVRNPGGVLVTSGIIGTTGSYQRHYEIPPVVNEKTDLEIRALAGATTGAAINLQLVLEDI